MHPLTLQQLAADHVNDMIAAAQARGRARHARRTRRPLEPPTRIAAAHRSAGSRRLRRAIRNPALELRHVPAPAPMPAG